MSSNTEIELTAGYHCWILSLCDPSESSWLCMFGDTEVPIQIIQDGVIC